MKPKHSKTWMPVEEAAAQFYGRERVAEDEDGGRDRLIQHLSWNHILAAPSSPSPGFIRAELDSLKFVTALHRADFEAWHKEHLRADAERRLRGRS